FVEDIRLTENGDPADDPEGPFFLGGDTECYELDPFSISAEDKRVVQVAFDPGSEPDGLFDGVLTIESDDPNKPILDVMLSGTKAQISELHVRINQMEVDLEFDPCPLEAEDPMEIYVSVTDQAGYPVTGLEWDNFSITEEGFETISPDGASYVKDGYVPISVALVMDYSGSITDMEDAVQDMENSVKSFIDQMKADDYGVEDEAEIIKFAGNYEVAAEFISDKEFLKAAVDAPVSEDIGEYTALYDAVLEAIQDTSDRDNVRKAVIVLTDGEDNESSIEIEDVKALGVEKNIPVFAAGLGDNINKTVLKDLTESTGGQYYEADISDNLKNTYQQLADVLYDDQYILTYNLRSPDSVFLTIKADYDEYDELELTGEHTKEITVCQ
ncbi:MAG: VWA domain-containing protein, partial [Desulfobacterales bacterium]